jgi:hypothetical protein
VTYVVFGEVPPPTKTPQVLASLKLVFVIVAENPAASPATMVRALPVVGAKMIVAAADEPVAAAALAYRA